MGFYRLKLFIEGNWKNITIDDYIPCWPKEGPLFTHSKDGSLWVQLLEKGFAKVYGGYRRIDGGGSVSEALQMMTGLPETQFSLTEPDSAHGGQTQTDDLPHVWKLLAFLKQRHSCILYATTTENAPFVQSSL